MYHIYPTDWTGPYLPLYLSSFLTFEKIPALPVIEYPQTEKPESADCDHDQENHANTSTFIFAPGNPGVYHLLATE